MNPQDNDSKPSDLSGAPGAAETEAAAPKPRRKRTVKAAEPAADAVSGAAPAAEAPAAEAAPADKPAAKRTRRKVAAPAEGDDAAEASAAVSPVADPAAVAAERPARTRRRAPAAAPAEAPAQAVAAAAVAPEAPSVPVAAAPVAVVEGGGDVSEASAPVADAAEGDGGDAGDREGRRGRNRNRRRGRRGEGRSEEGGDGAAAPQGQAGQGGAEDYTVVTVQPGASDDDEDDDEPMVVPPEAAVVGDESTGSRTVGLDVGEAFADVLSGAYDEAAGEAPPPPDADKRVLAADPDAPKLHKVLAQAGIGSRRDMEQLIADGKVQVNGQVAHTGQRISFGDRISVAGRQIKVRIAPLPARVLAYHKPVGEVVTHDDPQHRPTVFRRLPRLPQGKWQSVGRLDINTEGLLLFTNSGELANQLMHPRFGVEREYAVRVLGSLDAEGRQKLLDGVEIDGQRAQFKSIEDGGGEGVNHWYRVVINEGRNREVRKLFDKVGLAVSRLIRIRYGCVVLPRGLKRGVHVALNPAEVAELRRAAGGREQPRGERGERGERGDREGGGQRGKQRGQNRGQNRGDRGERDEQRNDRPPQERGPKEGRGPRQGGGNERRDRPDRAERADRGERAERPPRDRESDEFARIPNPLIQTFDKRAIREANRQPRREYSEDGPIPNPLEQTYDKRGVQKQNPFGRKGKGGGGGGGSGGGGGQPDPMKTSVGYIGADAFVRKFQNDNRGGGGGGGNRKRGRR